MITWCAYSSWWIFWNRGFFSYGRSNSEKQISYTCPSHAQTPTAVGRRHNTRTSRINSTSVTFYSTLSKLNVYTWLHYLKWRFHGKNLVISCLTLFGPFQSTYKMLPLTGAEILHFFCLVHRPVHTLSRYKWLRKVEKKLTLYTVIHRKDCISYLFLLRK